MHRLGNLFIAVGTILLALTALSVAAPGIFANTPLATILIDTTPPALLGPSIAGVVTQPTVIQTTPTGTNFYIYVRDNSGLSALAEADLTISSCVTPTSTCIAQITAQWGPGMVLSAQSCDATVWKCPNAGNGIVVNNALCGGSCYQLARSGQAPLSLKGQYLSILWGATDSVGNRATQLNWGFIDAPNGFFILNNTYQFCASGQVTNCLGQTATITLGSNILTWQFNATTLPSAITSVTLTVTNTSQTGNPTKSLCIVGPSPCANQPTTQAGGFYLYPSQAMFFASGAYNVTGAFSCTGCSLSSYRVLSIITSFNVITPPPIALNLVQISLGVLGTGFFATGLVLVRGPRKQS